MPRAIISCLYRVDTAQLESEPPGPLPLAVTELSGRAAELIAAFRVGTGRTFDLSGLQHGLLDVLLDGRLSPSSAAVVLHQVLAPIPIRDRASLALFLTNSIRCERLSALAHGTLLTLRRAISLEDDDVTLHALKRIDGVLAQRTSSLFWSGPVLAGSKLWVTSSKGKLVGVDPVTGKPVAERDLGAPLYLAPVVAAGRMYVLTDRASLVAIE